jgi:hypothetical protein
MDVRFGTWTGGVSVGQGCRWLQENEQSIIGYSYSTDDQVGLGQC